MKQQLFRMRVASVALTTILMLTACESTPAAPAPTPLASSPAAQATALPTAALPTAAPATAAPATAAPAPATAAPTAPPAATAAQPTPAAPPPSPSAAPQAAATVDAVQTVLDYYAALGRQEYARAYALWADDGAASGQSSGAFADGYADTVRISVLLDQERREGDTVTVPVTVFSVRNTPDQRQEAQRFAGTYTLQPAAGRWQITAAAVAAADPAGELPAGLGDGLSLVQAYYQAINAADYARAYTLWGEDGATSGQTYPAFVQGFGQTAKVELVAGESRAEGAAGSLYTQLPVVLFATQRDGARQAYCGTYTLQRSNLPPFDSLGWRIASASILAISDVQPGSQLVNDLLGGRCAAR